jgi:hypothetical protein
MSVSKIVEAGIWRASSNIVKLLQGKARSLEAAAKFVFSAGQRNPTRELLKMSGIVGSAEED